LATLLNPGVHGGGLTVVGVYASSIPLGCGCSMSIAYRPVREKGG